MRIVLLFGIVSILVAAGCSSGVGDVNGVVKYKGKAASGAVITFYDENNGAPSSNIAEDGSYSVKNVATGKARIAVMSSPGISMPGLPAAKSVQVPEKYANHEKSGLTLDVKRGSQTHNIDLLD